MNVILLFTVVLLLSMNIVLGVMLSYGTLMYGDIVVGG